MKVLKTKTELKTYFNGYSSKNFTIGFVPTMGALHNGHLSLIKESIKNNQITVASIFVNPTQFNKKEDLENYPRTLESDLSMLEGVSCDIAFIPSIEEIYADTVSANHFEFDGLEIQMEGKFRKGHFNGVGTIVKKLFEIVTPTNAYFGEKDFQQLQIIRKMVQKNQLPVSVIGCPTFREENGLAMSSRNQLLSEKEKEKGAIIYEILHEVKQLIDKKSIEKINSWVAAQFDENPLFELEYFVIADEETLIPASTISSNKNYRAFIAVHADKVRLIDTMSLQF
jgi:pantoate--beta-alanine ligase